jgi:hypothetical protein
MRQERHFKPKLAACENHLGVFAFADKDTAFRWTTKYAAIDATVDSHSAGVIGNKYVAILPN